MKKNLLYTALGLMGLMGTLAIGVVNATEPKDWVEGIDFDTIRIQNPDNPSEGFIIMDRNLGATTTGAGRDASEDAYGYYYQWGNNNGILWNEITTISLLPWNSLYSHKGYDGENKGFVNTNSRGDIRLDEAMHDDVWGGENDDASNYRGFNLDNYVDRQGPCPTGWHVPSGGERDKIFKYWCRNNLDKCANIDNNGLYGYFGNYDSNLTGKYFVEGLYIPYAGIFDHKGVKQSGYANLWSSSYHGCNGCQTVTAIDLEVYDFGGYYASYYNIRGKGAPIRCIYNSHQMYFIMTFDSNGGSEIETQKIIGNATGSRPDIPEKIGYSFVGRYDTQNFVGDEFDFDTTPLLNNITLYAKWTSIEYDITYELDGGVNNPKNVTGYTIEDTITFANPTKEGFTFDGWFTDAQFTTGITSISTGTTGPITVYAKWTENKKSSGSSGGGGGSSRSNKTSDTQDSSTSSQNDKNTENVIQSETKGSEESSKTPMDSSDKSSEGQEILSPSDSSFTKEQKDAYEFAKEKGITTMPTINEANMNGKLTRIAMAKMLSQYAMNVLGQKPANIVTPKFNDVTDKQNSDYDDGVTLAYQLGIMGQNMANNFRPDDEVTRAEFATALSRMLYGTSDGEYKSTAKYYTNHLKKLKEEGIITKDDPKMKELRGYVMIMLMRSAK